MFCAIGLVSGGTGTRGPDFKFCAPGLVSGGTVGAGSRFHVLRPGHVLGGTEGVGSRLHVLLSRTLFGCYQGRRVPFSCFALPDSFSTVPRASTLVFMFCAPRLFLGVTEGVGARIQVLRSQTRFWRYRGRRVPFSFFALPDSFRAVPRTPVPVFMFCTPGLVSGGTEGTGSNFHVLRSLTRFGRYRGRRFPFSCFALPDTFWVLPRASGLVYMFCAPELVFDGTKGVNAHFHVLRSRTLFGRYRGRRGSFSCFALPDMFLAVPRASRPVFMFCALGHVFGGTEGVGSR
jgi:hypothetical protein